MANRVYRNLQMLSDTSAPSELRLYQSLQEQVVLQAKTSYSSVLKFKNFFEPNWCPSLEWSPALVKST